ncbi:MAG: hypothetical protein QM655_09905 [Nocardioidaceae bacterium]
MSEPETTAGRADDQPAATTAAAWRQVAVAEVELSYLDHVEPAHAVRWIESFGA